MKLDEVANSKNDEFYTPPYAIEPLLKYLPRSGTVWCPFDTVDSHFAKMLARHGLTVILSHINCGQDFFSFEPSEYDYIISNPPYSKKSEVFQRLFQLEKPFAMLVGVVGIFESRKRFSLFASNNWEIMYFDKRVSYFKNYEDQAPSLNPPFSSVYITKGILPDRIVFEEIRKSRAAA